MVKALTCCNCSLILSPVLRSNTACLCSTSTNSPVQSAAKCASREECVVFCPDASAPDQPGCSVDCV